jgi:hypothetical protein
MIRGFPRRVARSSLAGRQIKITRPIEDKRENGGRSVASTASGAGKETAKSKPVGDHVEFITNLVSQRRPCGYGAEQENGKQQDILDQVRAILVQPSVQPLPCTAHFDLSSASCA